MYAEEVEDVPRKPGVFDEMFLDRPSCVESAFVQCLHRAAASVCQSLRSDTTQTYSVNVETYKISLPWVNSGNFYSDIGYAGHSSTHILISSSLVRVHRTDSMFPMIPIL